LENVFTKNHYVPYHILQEQNKGGIDMVDMEGFFGKGFGTLFLLLIIIIIFFAALDPK